MAHLSATAAKAPAEDALAAVGELLARMRFGSIALTVHEGKVVQLDITEKKRLGR